MTHASITCPHCSVRFSLPPGGAKEVRCPDCHKALVVKNAKPPEVHWYYARDKKRLGPHTTAQMQAFARAGTLKPGDMVLRSGAHKWTAASEVKEFFPPAKSVSTAGDISSRRKALAVAQVVPDADLCVQCGMCSFNCPMEIDVRAHAFRGKSIYDSHCLTCGECVKRCPRGVLSFEVLPLMRSK
jgi:ferredoxin